MGVKKKCSTCGETKGLQEFYKQECGLLGRTGSCKPCRRKKTREWAAKNKEKKYKAVKEYYENNKEKVAARYKKWLKENPWYFKEYYKQNREIRIEANKRFWRSNPDRYKKINEYKMALKSGVLVRPDLCRLCGKKGKIVGHHYDYNKPLDVTWVCHACHADIHRKHKFTKREKNK
jgi:hypothetical protein